MDSRTSTARDEVERQAEIRRQIALLQAQLKNKDDLSAPATPLKRKRKEEPAVIVAKTPSPKKRRTDTRPPAQRPPAPANAPPFTKKQPNLKQAHANPAECAPEQPLRPSKLLSNLASIRSQTDKATAEPPARSIAFADKPPDSEGGAVPRQERDDRLALVENLTPGPQDHKPPIDDPHFERLEPSSGIHLSSRTLAHADFQEHLRGRYYLSPSLLYSVIRPLPSNQGYDVPVPGDWLTIAIIAERGPIKLTSNSSSADHDDVTQSPAQSKAKRTKDAEKRKNPCVKKYMSLKLVDLGTRSSSGGRTQTRGDALLSLLLFEADSYSCIEDENRPANSRAERTKVYKGGSGGAFEACMKLHEGAVVAILNPKILKPYQRNMTGPHPLNNILAITPTSAESIAIIGHSRDFGTCVAVKRDGERCRSWCDKRVSDCCEYHVENAVKRKRASRPEFSIGTSGMTTTAQVRKPGFDPERKWGLLPAAGGGAAKGSSSGAGDGGSTYVVSGQIVSASGLEYVGEKIGRGRQERAARQREDRKTEEMLNQLLGRVGTCEQDVAAGAVRKAREVMKSLKGEEVGKPPVSEKDKDKDKEGRKNAYSAETIRRLGFDPTLRNGRNGEADDATLKRKMKVLESMQRMSGEVKLGRRPGKKL